MTVRKNQANLTGRREEGVRQRRPGAEAQGASTTSSSPPTASRFNVDMNTGIYVGHFGPSFLPWHRKYLIDFERELKKIDASVSIPYWDWTPTTPPRPSLWAPDFLAAPDAPWTTRFMDGPCRLLRRQSGTITVKCPTARPFLGP
ncbi:tyrosinase family protein [Streptomyces clavuligerus]|uniref:tyrosinase family protein n=1 Tax=Streptomyces clavuligerus TaxID=1901 RepID=UPI003B974421